MSRLIGQCINNYKIICDFNNERVIAYNRNAPQPWVVWRVDSDGGMYWGKYFEDAADARRYFVQSVSETRTTPSEINGIVNIRTTMLDGYLWLNYKSDTGTYDICSKHNFDFTDNPQHAWSAYIRELKMLTLKQVFEILNFEKMNKR